LEAVDGFSSRLHASCKKESPPTFDGIKLFVFWVFSLLFTKSSSSASDGSTWKEALSKTCLKSKLGLLPRTSICFHFNMRNPTHPVHAIEPKPKCRD
jgi:hypothetical protein